MKRVFNVLAVTAALLLSSAAAHAVQLNVDSEDAVKLDANPWWNLGVVEASNTTYSLKGAGGKSLSVINKGIWGTGGSSWDVSKDVTLTQGACNTLWGSTTNRDVHLYAAFANTYGTSTSASSPDEDISDETTDVNFKIAVDKNPVVTVALTVAELDSGALIAAALETGINAALEAASQGGRVDAEFTGGLYIITSRLRGDRSSVVVTDAASGNVADELKLGADNSGVEVAGAKGTQLCVSDVAGKTTVGAVALGAAGYTSCTTTLPSAQAVRQVATADLNCTGPVIGTVKEHSTHSAPPLPIKKYGTASSATSGAAALVFEVKGLAAADDCVVTPVSFGTGPTYVKFAAVTADTITVTVDQNQTGSSTVINYACW